MDTDTEGGATPELIRVSPQEAEQIAREYEIIRDSSPPSPLRDSCDRMARQARAALAEYQKGREKG